MSDLNVNIHDQEQVKKLKRLLEGWRMALLHLKSVILWEQQWHPCAIVGSVSFIFFIIWLMDLNFLATFAILGLFINFIDFMVPIICNTIYGHSSWSGQQEKAFEEICKSIVSNYNQILRNIHAFCSLRETTPIMYYIISISLLCTLAWIASYINNIFLLFITSTMVLLWPGIKHSGIFNKLLSVVNMAPKKAV